MTRQPLPPGSIVQVYNDPVSQKEHAFQGTVLTCLQPDVGSWNGRSIRMYRVRPDGIDFASLSVLVLDPEDPA